MKTLLVAINSQFIHSNLAVRYLKASCNESCGQVKIIEYSVNEPLISILTGIALEEPDAVAFSCYIWNIEIVGKLADDLKKLNPGIIIIAGGPEVSFEGGGLLSEKKSIDYIISGEGEEKFPFLLKILNSGACPNAGDIKWLKGLSVIKDLGAIPSPYNNTPKNSQANKITYIEASRGCPFRCSYCISSTTKGVRYFPLEKVYETLQVLVNSGSGIIKFVDRTFNANEKRAVEIWSHVRRYEKKNVVFHFEIDPGLITENIIGCLAEMPPGLIQIEAGIQSIHEKTLSAVGRPFLIDRALSNLKKILSFGNIHVHVDLIAGLPYESLSDFRQSFNQVYSLNAHHLQLGFLKMLIGSSIRNNYHLHDYKYRNYPPYEVISNRYLSAMDLLSLKDIEACVELFYNSGRFVTTLELLIEGIQGQNTAGPFGFFESLAVFMRKRGYLDRPVKASMLYSIMLKFINENFPSVAETLKDNMRFDYFRSFKNPSLPEILKKKYNESGRKTKRMRMDMYREELERVLPRLRKMPLEKAWNQILITEFEHAVTPEFPSGSVVAIDFGDVSPVTGLAAVYLLKN